MGKASSSSKISSKKQRGGPSSIVAVEEEPNKITKRSTQNSLVIHDDGDDHPPKSKKQLRAERKLARMAPEERRKRERQQQKRMEDKALFAQCLQQEREEQKRRQLRKRNREKNNMPSSTLSKKQRKSLGDNSKNTAAQQDNQDKNSEDAVTQKILHQIKYGSHDETSGLTTLERGVQIKDIVVGQGPEQVPPNNNSKHKCRLTVRYKLTKGGFDKHAAVIDASKAPHHFSFHLHRGEVVKGWDIGLVGMKVGGRRQLIVPPKAGYGAQDIGAGAGALLYFDISLLSVR